MISAATMPRWVMNACEVSPSIINSVKEEVKTNKVGLDLSALKIIAAHMGRSLARLLPAMFSGLDPKITMVVEGRAKFYDRPLPKFLSGNVIALMMSTQIL